MSAHGQGSPQPPQRSTWTLTPLGCPVHGLGPQWRPRGHAPSVQWGSPAGAPLYPRLRIRLLRVTITAPTWLRVHAALVDAVFARSRKYSRHVGLLTFLPCNNHHSHGPQPIPNSPHLCGRKRLRSPDHCALYRGDRFSLQLPICPDGHLGASPSCDGLRDYAKHTIPPRTLLWDELEVHHWAITSVFSLYGFFHCGDRPYPVVNLIIAVTRSVPIARTVTRLSLIAR